MDQEGDCPLHPFLEPPPPFPFLCVAPSQTVLTPFCSATGTGTSNPVCRPYSPPSLPSFLQGPVKAVEKRRYGRMGARGFATSLGSPACCQVRTHLRDDQVLWQGGD